MQTVPLFRVCVLYHALVFMPLIYCVLLCVIAHMLPDYVDPSLTWYDISEANNNNLRDSS